MAAGFGHVGITIGITDLFYTAMRMNPYLEEGLHSMRGLPNVIDVGNIGFMGAIELEPYPECPGRRGKRSHGAVLRGRGDGASDGGTHRIVPAVDRERGGHRRHSRYDLEEPAQNSMNGCKKGSPRPVGWECGKRS